MSFSVRWFLYQKFSVERNFPTFDIRKILTKSILNIIIFFFDDTIYTLYTHKKRGLISYILEIQYKFFFKRYISRNKKSK